MAFLMVMCPPELAEDSHFRDRPSSKCAQIESGRSTCHSRASGNPESNSNTCWMPAFAGMTSGVYVRPPSTPGLFFQEPGHDFDEIAGPMADVELPFENAVPAILHRTGRAGQGEQIGAARHAGTGARLHRRGADLGGRDLVEKRGEAVDLFLEHALERFH